MMLITSLMFANAVNLQNPQPEYLGLTLQELIDVNNAKYQPDINSLQKVIMISILAMSFCGFSTIVIKTIFIQPNAKIIHFGCYYVSNGMLSGVISVSASCTGIELWHGILISLVASVLYHIGSRLLARFKIDDPLEASLVFGIQGLWGIVAAGIFDRTKGWLYTGNFS